MRRAALDEIARGHTLSEPAIALALDLTGARPDREAWRTFARRLCGAAGIAALGAGAIFFVAANWQDYGLLGRFAILQAAFALSVAVAWWRPPPQVAGQAGTILAILLTGALLALFGQSYQTGADLYELFFIWAILALPFALAGQSGAAWATWWIVLNVALALYFGWLEPGRLLRRWLDGRGLEKAATILLPGLVNLAGAALFLYLGKSGRWASHAPRWLVRMLATLGFLYATAASIAAVTTGSGRFRDAGFSAQDAIVTLAFALICAGIVVAALRARRDVFPLALVAGSWIAISTAWIIGNIRSHDLGSFFMIAMWLIITSTGTGYLLMRWVRAWRISEDAPGGVS